MKLLKMIATILKKHCVYAPFFFQKLYIVPVANQSDIPFSRVNHNKYMVTDKVAYIGEKHSYSTNVSLL